MATLVYHPRQHASIRVLIGGRPYPRPAPVGDGRLWRQLRARALASGNRSLCGHVDGLERLGARLSWTPNGARLSEGVMSRPAYQDIRARHLLPHAGDLCELLRGLVP
jgi:hypothetical protein